MNLSLNLDTAQFRSAAQDAVKKLGANAELLIKEEARFAIRDYVKQTPPFAKGGFNKSVGSAADKKAGEAAIKSDLSSISQGANETFLQFVIDTFGGATQIRRQFFKKGTDKPYLIDWDRVSFSIDELKSHHLKKRNRYGRTPSRKKGSGGRGEADMNIGRWVAREKLIVPYQVFMQYLSKLLKNVGSEKGAFSMAASRLGLRLPSWVRPMGGGYFEQKLPSFSILISAKSQRPQAGALLDSVVKNRGNILEREVKRLMRAFADTGKIPTRRKSFNQ